jgi:hypothetical protein
MKVGNARQEAMHMCMNDKGNRKPLQHQRKLIFFVVLIHTFWMCFMLLIKKLCF